MSQYILVDAKSLSVSVHGSGQAPDRAIIVPDPADRNLTHQVAKDLLFDILEAAVRKARRNPTGVEFCLAPPDPWLVAIATVMRDGIIQGLTWAAVKAAVAKAMRALRASRVAPPAEVPDRERMMRLGFTWVDYCAECKQRELFLGLERIYRPAPKKQAGSLAKGRSSKVTKRKAEHPQEAWLDGSRRGFVVRSSRIPGRVATSCLARPDSA